MENEQVNAEGLEAGQEAPAGYNAVAGNSTPDLPTQTIEERFAEILYDHDMALKGISATVMSLMGRIADIETFLLGVGEEKQGE